MGRKNKRTDRRNQCEYALVKGMLSLCRILPEPCVFALIRGGMLLAYAFIGSRRKLALRNLAIAFPEKTLRERKRIARRSILNLAESLACNALLMGGRISDERLMGMVEVDDEERLGRIKELPPKGLLVISAHLGNWELMPNYAALRTGMAIHVIARETSNPLLEEHIVKPLRNRFGVNVFYKKNAVMKIMKALRKGHPVGLMVDQRLAPPTGLRVAFFGRKTGTAAIPALLQIRHGIATAPLFMVRTGRMRFRLVTGEPVEWRDDGRPMEQQVADLTRIHQGIVEDAIRAYPDQWFWVHDRWGLAKGNR